MTVLVVQALSIDVAFRRYPGVRDASKALAGRSNGRGLSQGSPEHAAVARMVPGFSVDAFWLPRHFSYRFQTQSNTPTAF